MSEGEKIIELLGGEKKIQIMLGAYGFVKNKYEVTFLVRTGNYNRIKIRDNGIRGYDISFQKRSDEIFIDEKTVTNIKPETLIQTIEKINNTKIEESEHELQL